MRHNQNRRPRGRSRKGPNPLTRSYESNGPDVKVRGTASHVAEKYMMLARDALSSGDPVSAENYHQHAEHYNRIVAAAQQAQFQQAQQAQQSQQRDGSDDGRGDERSSKNADNAQGNDQGNDQQDDQAASTADRSGESDNAVVEQQGQEATGGDNDKAERPRRSRRPRTEAGDDGSANKSSSEPNAAASGDSDAAATDTPKPNGRRRKPAAAKTAASSAEDAVVTEAEGDTTQDGTAALAAFPD